jgi:hypothetical protein
MDSRISVVVAVGVAGFVVVAVGVAVFVASGGVASARSSHKSHTALLAVRIETQKLTFVDTGPPAAHPATWSLNKTT